jgi:hypothetical protein
VTIVLQWLIFERIGQTSKLGSPVRIVAPTIIRFSAQFLIANTRPGACIVDLSCDETGESRVSAVNATVSKFMAIWQDNVAPCIMPTTAFAGAHWIDLDSLNGTSGFLSNVAGHPSTGTVSASDVEPPNVALLIKKSCNATRSQKNGRMYLPGVATTWVNNGGDIPAGNIATVNTAMASLRNGLLGIGDIVGLETTAWRVVHVHKVDKADPATWKFFR